MAEQPALRHALALGLLQGPTELLPVSSSAHTQLVAELAGWPYARADAAARKTFEVALHVGAGAALAVHMRRELLRDAAALEPRQLALIALAISPPALAGLLFERAVERHLGGSRSIAVGLLAGAGALALGELRASALAQERTRAQALPRDGLALGLAQALALMPGISRSGATLAAARAGGFARADAHALSWHAGLPVLLGAGALKATRLRAQPPSRGERAALAVGAAGAFGSTLASARALERGLARRSPLPYALYRCLLAGALLSRARRRGHANAVSS